MTRYTVTAERTSRWWVLQAVEAPGAISQVARLDQADQIREAIAFVTGEPAEGIEVELRLSGEHALLESYRQIRHQADELQSEVQRSSEEVAEELVSEGLSYRDAGALMGLSHQRVGQLVGRKRRDLVSH